MFFHWQVFEKMISYKYIWQNCPYVFILLLSAGVWGSTQVVVWEAKGRATSECQVTRTQRRRGGHLTFLCGGHRASYEKVTSRWCLRTGACILLHTAHVKCFCHEMNFCFENHLCMTLLTVFSIGNIINYHSWNPQEFCLNCICRKKTQILQTVSGTCQLTQLIVFLWKNLQYQFLLRTKF